MGFKNLRLFAITNEAGDDGYPEYGDAIRLQGNVTAGETAPADFNSVSVSLTPIKKTRTLAADDTEKEYEKYVGYDIELEVYRVEKEAVGNLFGYVKDSDSNIKEVVGSTDKKKFGLFFQGSTADGVEYQKYLYKIEFFESEFQTATDSGEGTDTLKLIGRGYPIVETDQTQVKAYTVYKGSDAWVDTGIATAMYKGPEPTPEPLVD